MRLLDIDGGELDLLHPANSILYRCLSEILQLHLSHGYITSPRIMSHITSYQPKTGSPSVTRAVNRTPTSSHRLYRSSVHLLIKVVITRS